MDREPRKLGGRMLEFALLFALSAFLLKLGAHFLLEIWWVLLVIAIVIAGTVLWFRIRRGQGRW